MSIVAGMLARHIVLSAIVWRARANKLETQRKSKHWKLRFGVSVRNDGAIVKFSFSFRDQLANYWQNLLRSFPLPKPFAEWAHAIVRAAVPSTAPIVERLDQLQRRWSPLRPIDIEYARASFVRLMCPSSDSADDCARTVCVGHLCWCWCIWPNVSIDLSKFVLFAVYIAVLGQLGHDSMPDAERIIAVWSACLDYPWIVYHSWPTPIFDRQPNIDFAMVLMLQGIHATTFDCAHDCHRIISVQTAVICIPIIPLCKRSIKCVSRARTRWKKGEKEKKKIE